MRALLCFQPWSYCSQSCCICWIVLCGPTLPKTAVYFCLMSYKALMICRDRRRRSDQPMCGMKVLWAWTLNSSMKGRKLSNIICCRCVNRCGATVKLTYDKTFLRHLCDHAPLLSNKFGIPLNLPISQQHVSVRLCSKLMIDLLIINKLNTNI